MIQIIHGDDIPQVMKKRDELVGSSSWINSINVAKEPVDAITNACEADALFTKERIVILENVHSIKGTPGKKILEYIKKYTDITHLTLILIATDILSDTFLKHFKSAQVYVYRLPKYYFDFLDNLAPRKAKLELELLMKLTTTMTAEQVYYSITKRVRLLLLLHANSHHEFEDVKALPPWQLTRLEKQSHAWTKDQLIEFYKQLFQLEVGMKTSSLQLPLSKHIDILLATALN